MAQGRPSYTEVFKERVNSFHNYYRWHLKKSLENLVIKEEDYIKIQSTLLGIPESLYLEINKYPDNKLKAFSISLLVSTPTSIVLTIAPPDGYLRNYVDIPFYENYEKVEDILDPYYSFTLKRIKTFEDACEKLKELSDKYTIQNLWKWSDIPRTVVNTVYGEIEQNRDNFSDWCNKTPAGTNNKFLELEPINEVLVWYNIYKAQQPK